MGLMGFFNKQKKTNSAGEDLDHLTPEGELPWGWYYANKDFAEKLENEYRHFSNAMIDSRKDGVLAEYAAIKSMVVFMEDAKALCASKGECFVKWSSIAVACPETLESYKERLKSLDENMDVLLRQERILKQLGDDLLQIINEKPGVIQSQLYNRFDDSMKFHISNELYQLEAHDMIVREKSGKSYKLYIK